MRAFTGRHSIWAIVGAYLALHVLLILVFDSGNPDAFLRGDRSHARLLQIQRVLSSQDLNDAVQAVFRYGVPGDYLWQGAFMGIGGVLGVKPHLLAILFQVLLAAGSVYGVGGIARELTLNVHLPWYAAAGYALLPNSTVFPHMLVSEAVFVPLCVFGVFFTLRAFHRGTWADGLASGLLWAAAGLTRPTALLIPLFIVVVWVWRHRALLPIALLCSGYLLIVGIWVVGSTFFFGRPVFSNGDPEMFQRNLLGKVDYVLAALPAGEREGERVWRSDLDSTRGSMGAILGLYCRHPMTTAKVLGIELAKMLAKFNETKILNYLGLWEAQNNWGAVAQEDPGSVLAQKPWVLAVIAMGTTTWVLVLALAVRGVRYIGSFRDPAIILLAVYTLYSLASALSVDFTQGRHRYPVDFVICILAATTVRGFLTARRRLSLPAPSGAGRLRVPEPEPSRMRVAEPMGTGDGSPHHQGRRSSPHKSRSRPV